MPTRTNELFNPLAQSPVKMRVEAFENAAAAATEHSKRPLRNKKENATPSTTTPVIGKLAAPALGRFLTPTQSSNLSSVNSAVAKKTTTSASKALPVPKSSSIKICIRILHEDDSTDDEDKVSCKRPPPPSWSRSHVRGPFMLKQEYAPAAYIDSFFSVQPMTPYLKIIFPNIDARHLKRKSNVLWSTPPRYSELPKY